MYTGGRGESRRPPSALPLPRLSCSQALGKISADSKPEENQPAYQPVTLQDGNTEVHPPPAQTRGLDCVHRPKGRLPSRTYRSRIQGRSRLRSSRKRVPFQGATVRPKARTTPRSVLVVCVAAFLRQQGLRIFCYLDDWLLAVESRELLSRQLHFLLRTVQGLGFIVNWEKSELTPSRHPNFLGAAIDLPRQLARPSPDRVYTIIAAALRLRRRRQAPARTWFQFLGYLASLVDVLPDCRLHMRPLQIHLLMHYRPSVDALTRLVPLPSTIRLLLLRWSRRNFLTTGATPCGCPSPLSR